MKLGKVPRNSVKYEKLGKNTFPIGFGVRVEPIDLCLEQHCCKKKEEKNQARGNGRSVPGHLQGGIGAVAALGVGQVQVEVLALGRTQLGLLRRRQASRAYLEHEGVKKKESSVLERTHWDTWLRVR